MKEKTLMETHPSKLTPEQWKLIKNSLFGLFYYARWESWFKRKK